MQPQFLHSYGSASDPKFRFLTALLFMQRARDMDIITFVQAPFFPCRPYGKGGKMTEREKIRFIDYLRLRTRLGNASSDGSMLMLEGRCSDAETIASVCVFNDTGYYMDEQKGDSEEDPGVILVGLGHESS